MIDQLPSLVGLSGDKYANVASSAFPISRRFGGLSSSFRTSVKLKVQSLTRNDFTKGYVSIGRDGSSSFVAIRNHHNDSFCECGR